MKVSVGTFNVNNLFERYDWLFKVSQSSTTSKGMIEPLRKAKNPSDTKRLAQRILRAGIDVLALQEVENYDALVKFNSRYLNNYYDYLTMIEGNDPRFVECAIMSKFPIGKLTTYRHAVHLESPIQPVFSNNFLQVEILNSTCRKRLFHLFVTQFYDQPTDDKDVETVKYSHRRRREAQMAETIMLRECRRNSRFILAGSFTAEPESKSLSSLANSFELKLTNALLHPLETRQMKKSSMPPNGPAWTFRIKRIGQPPEYLLYDQIWLSPVLTKGKYSAWIDRRTRITGDGSDHDLAWIVIDI